MRAQREKQSTYQYFQKANSIIVKGSYNFCGLVIVLELYY